MDGSVRHNLAVVPDAPHISTLGFTKNGIGLIFGWPYNCQKVSRHHPVFGVKGAVAPWSLLRINCLREGVKAMKRISLFLLMALFSIVGLAQQTMRPDGAGGWIINGNNSPCGNSMGGGFPSGFAATLCADQQKSQQQLQQQQIENQRLQNELLRRQLDQEKAASQAQQLPPSQGDFQSWSAVNTWYGRDKAKTEFANLYGQQLRQNQPALIGRPFLDAVSSKVYEVFGTSQTGQSN